MLICTRFGLRVKNLEWLQHRLTLLKAITAPSLLAQTDQHFDWHILIDDTLPADLRTALESVIAPFGHRATIEAQPLHRSHTLVQRAISTPRLSNSDYLLTARIDDDDAWSIHMVQAVRQEIATWLSTPQRAPGLSLSYQDGLEWIMYRMLEIGALQNRNKRIWQDAAIRKYRLPFIGMSVFVCAPFSEVATAMGDGHSRVADTLSRQKGYAKTIISTEAPMWLCCRHKQAGSAIKKARGDFVTIDLTQLAAQFGINNQLTQRYIDHADDYAYSIVKEPIAKKYGLIADLRQIDAELAKPDNSMERRKRLLEQQGAVRTELDRLETDVLGMP